jgi:hypothetical protein
MDDPFRPLDAFGTEDGEIFAESRVAMVEEVAEDVNILIADAGAQFHSGNDFHAESPALFSTFIDSVRVVVVGDADDGKTGLLCPPHELCRRQNAVGIESVRMKVGSTLHATHAAGKEQVQPQRYRLLNFS